MGPRRTRCSWVSAGCGGRRILEGRCGIPCMPSCGDCSLSTWDQAPSTWSQISVCLVVGSALLDDEETAVEMTDTGDIGGARYTPTAQAYSESGVHISARRIHYTWWCEQATRFSCALYAYLWSTLVVRLLFGRCCLERSSGLCQDIRMDCSLHFRCSCCPSGQPLRSVQSISRATLAVPPVDFLPVPTFSVRREATTRTAKAPSSGRKTRRCHEH